AQALALLIAGICYRRRSRRGSPGARVSSLALRLFRHHLLDEGRLWNATACTTTGVGRRFGRRRLNDNGLALFASRRRYDWRDRTLHQSLLTLFTSDDLSAQFHCSLGRNCFLQAMENLLDESARRVLVAMEGLLAVTPLPDGGIQLRRRDHV